MTFPRLALFAFAYTTSALAVESLPLIHAGVARIDITPETPIRLSGYGSRNQETSRVEQRLFARALALGSDQQKPAVLITCELVGIPEWMRDAVARSLQESRALDPARVAICATHTHTGPSLKGVLPYMFGQELPSEQQARIDHYSAALVEKLVGVANAALADRRPGRLAWAEGRAGFTGHRRVVVNGKWTGFGRDPNGPADYALPVLRVTDEQGAVRAVFVSYACHCTTLSGNDNFVHGDWAGAASAQIESAHDGAVALVAQGCGGDANPNPRGSLEQVAAHGRTIAVEVARLVAGPMRSLGPVTAARYRRIELELDHAVTRDELAKRLEQTQKQPPKFSASKFVAMLDAGQPLPSRVPYPIQTWRFGDELAMVFLAGEVVSEYSLRLRRELDPARLWVNAYANSVPCYVASRRMYQEGGYEVDGSMDYYGWPTRLAIGTEDQIIGAVHEMLPGGFQAAPGK